jgi:hypothetical protein
VKAPIITGMRLLLVAGVLLAAIGIFVVLKGVQLHSTGLVNVGPFHSTVHEEHTLPPLFGWIAIVIGVVLAAAGGFGRRAKR